MKLSYEDHELISVITVSGDLTSDQVDAFRRACQDRFDAGVRDLIVHIEHMTLIDSAGLEQLLWLIDEVGKRQGRLRLVNPDETVRRILELTRLNRKFDIHETVESAGKSLR